MMSQMSQNNGVYAFFSYQIILFVHDKILKSHITL